MATTTLTDSLPSRDIIEERIDTQRDALWRAAAVVEMVATALDGGRDPVNGDLLGGMAQEAALALRAANSLIHGATGELEALQLLRAQDEAADEVQS